MKSQPLFHNRPTSPAGHKGFSSGSILVKCLVAAFLVLVAGLFAKTYVGFKCIKRPNQTEAINNARQIGMALFEFQEKFGHMPDADTIQAVRQSSETDLKLGTKSSNDFFRQLFASGMAQSEPMFYAKVSGIRKPDGIITGASALAKGECGFTYFTGAIYDCNPDRPILATPLIPGTSRFDPKPFDGKAVILRADSSVMSFPIIKKSGRVLIDGHDLMDPANPIWEGNPPVIAYPEF